MQKHMNEQGKQTRLSDAQRIIDRYNKVGDYADHRRFGGVGKPTPTMRRIYENALSQIPDHVIKEIRKK